MTDLFYLPGHGCFIPLVRTITVYTVTMTDLLHCCLPHNPIFHFARATFVGITNGNDYFADFKFYFNAIGFDRFGTSQFLQIRFEGGIQKLAQVGKLGKLCHARATFLIHVGTEGEGKDRNRRIRPITTHSIPFSSISLFVESSSRCSSFVSRQFRSLPFRLARWPTSRCYYRCPKECREGGEGRTRIVFCAVRSILRHGDTRVRARVQEYNVGVLDSIERTRVFGNIFSLLASYGSISLFFSPCNTCKIRVSRLSRKHSREIQFLSREDIIPIQWISAQRNLFLRYSSLSPFFHPVK